MILSRLLDKAPTIVLCLMPVLRDEATPWLDTSRKEHQHQKKRRTTTQAKSFHPFTVRTLRALEGQIARNSAPAVFDECILTQCSATSCNPVQCTTS